MQNRHQPWQSSQCLAQAVRRDKGVHRRVGLAAARAQHIVGSAPGSTPTTASRLHIFVNAPVRNRSRRPVPRAKMQRVRFCGGVRASRGALPEALPLRAATAGGSQGAGGVARGAREGRRGERGKARTRMRLPFVFLVVLIDTIGSKLYQTRSLGAHKKGV